MDNAVPGADQPRLGRHRALLNLSRQPMLVLAGAGLTGIAADRALAITPDHWPLLVILAIGGVVSVWPFDRLRYGALLVLWGIVFGYYHHQRFNHFPPDTLARFIPQERVPLIIRGIVRSPVEKCPDSLAQQRSTSSDPQWRSIFEIEAESIREHHSFRPSSGRARVIVGGVIQGLLIGDRVELLCQAERIPPRSNPGEPDFQKIYRLKRQLVRIYVKHPEQVRLISSGRLSLARLIGWIGDRGGRAIHTNMNARAAPLADALVLGRRQAVDRALRDHLLETGTIHLLAVSGLHVGIVAMAVMWMMLLIGAPRTTTLLIVIAVCVAYMLLTGARPPVLRAATLIGIFLIGRLLGKRPDPLNTLATAAVLLMLIDPLSIIHVGTHLSFLAVATIVLFTTAPRPPAQLDPLDKLLQSKMAIAWVWIQNFLAGLVRVVALSFWIGAMGLPLVWSHFHVISTISIIANILLWIPLSIAVISGLVTAIAGGIWMPLGRLPGEICEHSLALITDLVSALAAVPGGHFWMPAPSTGLVIAFYAVAAMLPLVISGRWWRWGMLGWVGIWVAIAACSSTYQPSRSEMTATFIDVGHGTSVLLQFPSGENWLYDAGRLGDPLSAKWPIEAVLWSEGIRRLDTIVVSHADADHYNAIDGLSSRFKIDRVVCSSEVFPSEQSGVIALEAALIRESIPIHLTSTGETLFSADSTQVRVLHPPPEHIPESDNANSVVLQIDVFERSLVLPGDLEEPGMTMLLAQAPPISGGVLMAPHHGSLSQQVSAILTWADPSIIVASGGRRAADPRVKTMLSETGARIFITHNVGAVRIRLGPTGIHVRSWINDPW